MGDGFVADVTALTAAGQQAQALADTLREQTQNAFADGAASFGHAELEQAVAAFHSRWRDGMTVFASEGDSVAQRLATTVSAYQEVDRTNTDAFTQIGELRG